MKGWEGRSEAADIFMNGAGNPGAGAWWQHPGPLSPAPRSCPPLSIHEAWPTHSSLAHQTGPFVPAHVRDRGAAASAASTGKGEVGGGRRKGPPTGKRVPA